MKKLIVFLVFICAVFHLHAQISGQSNTRSVWTTYKSICIGDSSFVSLLEDFDSVNYCVYSHEGIYDTSYTSGIFLKPSMHIDSVIVYVLENVDGEVPTDIYRWIVSGKPFSTISIDSIHHVTCPDGYLYPYGDGSFHVSLDDSVQNYAWIDIGNEEAWFWTQSYDSITLTNLRSGTYRIVAHGTNGCTYTDSVVIEQPEPWDWDPAILYIDTVCYGNTGCIVTNVVGGTPPYTFTWFYFSDTGQVFMPDTTRMICGVHSREYYCVYIYDSRGCKADGEEIEYVFYYLYEYVEDTTHLITTNPIACYGSPFLVQAQSIGYGDYVWHVGDSIDTINYWTWVAADSVLIADFYTPPMTEPTFVSVDFYDQHGCVTHDSVWVNIYNPETSLTIETTEITTDSTFTVHVSPPGGSLYIDDIFIAENVPETYTLSTTGFLVGEHILRYYGVFGVELDLQCEDEISIPFQIQSRPFVTAWDQEISIYPNPATTVLNLSSTDMMDFSISITDITGRVIMRENIMDSFYHVDVSNLTSGIYLLHLETPEGATKSIKFIKH